MFTVKVTPFEVVGFRCTSGTSYGPSWCSWPSYARHFCQQSSRSCVSMLHAMWGPVSAAVHPVLTTPQRCSSPGRSPWTTNDALVCLIDRWDDQGGRVFTSIMTIWTEEWIERPTEGAASSRVDMNPGFHIIEGDPTLIIINKHPHLL